MILPLTGRGFNAELTAHAGAGVPLGVSERRACRVLDHAPASTAGTRRRAPIGRAAHRARDAGWAVRLSTDHGAPAGRRLAGASQPGGTALAAVLDLFSRFPVGWAVSAVNDRHLVIKALPMALQRRRPVEGLGRHGMTGSMSRRGNCYDNAVMESGFSTLWRQRCGGPQTSLVASVEASTGRVV